MKSAILALFLLLASFHSSVADSDVGLYGAKIPEDAAFIRFINLSFHQQSPNISGKDYPQLKGYGVSPYYIVRQGGHVLSSHVKGKLPDFDITVEPQKFYSVILADGINLIKDKAVEDRSKAVVAFYNFSSKGGVSLKANNGDVSIFENVGGMNMEARDINAAKIDFGVYGGDSKLAELNDVILERNNHYSFIYDDSGLRFFQSSIDTNQ